MDPSVPASFIPKKPIGASAISGGSAAFGVFFLLLTIIVLGLSVAGAGAVFAYKAHLKTAITEKSATLKQAEAAFDPDTIKELARLDSRINNASALLQKHVTVLTLFDYIGQQTLEQVQLTSFSYDLKPDGAAQISFSGSGDSFATVALQSDQLNASKIFKDLVFSGVAAGAEGKVTFGVKATVDSSLLSYSKLLTTTQTSATSQNQPATMSSTTTQ